MSTPPFVRFYANDWFTGCAGLKADERGVYVTMCVYIWTTGRRVPLDDAEASRMMSLNFKSYQRIRDRLVVLGKVTRHENGYGNDRAEHELAAATEAAAGKGRTVSTPDRGDEGRAPETAQPRAEAPKNAETNGAVLIDRRIDDGIDPAIDGTIDGTIEAQKIEQNQCASIEPEPRTIKKEDSPLPPDGGRESLEANSHRETLKAFEAYNDRALVLGLPQASKLTPDRRRRINARLRDFGQDGWAKALVNLDTPFLRGLTEHRFRADLDFVCQPKSFSKLHDGGYAPAQGTPDAADRSRPSRNLSKSERLKAAVDRAMHDNVTVFAARPSWKTADDADAHTVLPVAETLRA